MFATFAVTRRAFLSGAAAGLLGAAAAVRLQAQEDGFEPIFNGADLTGWEGDPLLWVVEDGELVGRSPGIPYNDFLATEERFGDFTLRFDVRLVDNIGNSGMQFRSERVPGSMEMAGYQADVGEGWWGDLYDESRRRETLVDADPAVIAKALKPNEFNAYEVRATGPNITLSINGAVTAEYVEQDDSVARDGRLAVQIHSGPALEVRFRNIRVKR